MEETGAQAQSKLSVFRNRPEFTALIILVSFYLFISNYFVWGQAFVGGVVNTSGGSDPYYNFRIIQHILTYHTALLHDPSLAYPLGANNPRPPFFYFLTVLVAVIISPAVGGIANGAYYFFNEVDALFGAFLIIPVYLITNQVFGKKAGIIAATLYTLMPSNLSAGILTDGRLHTPELLFGFFAVYFFQRSVGTISKSMIIDNLRSVRSYIPSIRKFIGQNRLATIYSLLSGASLGGLILSWQGFPYIEIIILLYVVVQLIVNVVTKEPTGHLTYLTLIFLFVGFALGAYPYYAISYGYMHLWLIQPFEIGLAILGLSFIFNVFGRRPWIITIPSIAAIAVLGVIVIGHFAPAVIHAVVTGQGYFVKNRLYSTIAEASSPALGQYISGFGAGQFVLGMAGVAYLIYIYLKKRTENFLFLLVFSVVSIYMSFAAARFNITAAPAYAALGAGLLVFFTDTAKLSEMKKRRVISEGSVRRSVKGNINWLHAATSILVVILLIVPAGFAMVSAAVPANTAQSVDKQIMNSIPPSLRFGNTSQGTVFVGGFGFSIINSSDPFSQSMSWLTNQDKNQPMNQRPAYVSWWDYGFQEMYQGQHPAVADDFQQGYEVAGQVLLAQNNSQVVSLFLARIIQGDFQKNGNHFSQQVNDTLKQYFGSYEANLIGKISANPSNYITWINDNSTVYGNFIKSITSSNAYFALIKGQLSTKYSVETINNAYLALERETGYSIKYLQIPNGLFPTSGINPGIFYAPAYLTDTPSYSSSGGQIVPTNYYQVYALTANGTYPLNQLPAGVQPLNYSIQYTPAFYNTSIYRFTMGYPPSVTGHPNGLPGITYGQGTYQIMPAWNMSNFEITYEGIPWNPFSDYQNHSNAWKIIPLQQAYQYQQQGKGIAELFPPPNQIVPAGEPIVSYYPGAKLTGQITLQNGQPAPGIRVTVFDQYGIPHQTTLTNSNGYYNLTGLPGNDTLVITTGSLNQNFLIGQTSIKNIKVHVSQDQANQIVTGYNSTNGNPSYVIENNYVLGNNSVSGFVRDQYQKSKNLSQLHPFSQPLVNTGKIELHNSTYNISYTLNITDGQYSANNLLPFSYRASVLSGGNTYTNVSYVNISNGASQVDDIFIQYDTMFVNVTGGGGSPLPGYQVVAAGPGGSQYTNTTNSTGGAVVWVPPGNYSVYAENNYSVSPIMHQSFQSWNLNTSLNVTPEVSGNVSGRLNGASSGVRVSFLVNGIEGNMYSTTTSAGGYYSISLPYGVYTAYANSNGSVAARTTTVSGPATMNLSLSPGISLSVGSTLKALNLYAGAYQIMGPNMMLQANFSKQVTDNFILPSGAYSIAGTASYLGTQYSAFTHINLVGTRNINLSLVQNQQISIFAFDKSVINGYNANSAIEKGVVVLYQSNVPVMYAEVGPHGFAQLQYSGSNSSGYSISYESAYYSAPSVSYTGSSIYFPVTPRDAVLSVSFHPDSSSGKVAGTFSLAGTRNYNFTIIRDGLSANVLPGVYYGSITGSNTVSVPDNPVFVVSAGTNHYSTGVMQYASVSVAGASSYSLYSSTAVMAKNVSSVPVGVYTVYATNGSKSLITVRNITSNTTLSSAYSQGYSLDLKNSLSVPGGNYYVKTGSAVLNLTEGKWTLPQGNYQVSYRYDYTNSTGSYHLSANDNISLSSNAVLNMSLASSKAQTGLYGLATFQSTPSKYTTVEVLNSKGLVVNISNTNSAGYYNMSLAPGTYTIYGVNNASMQGYFQSVTVAPFSGYNQYNLSMRQGYKTYLSVNANSQLLDTNVTISIGTRALLVNSTNSGPYVLPQGNYTFSAGITQSQKVYNGTVISVSYGTNYTTDINQQNSYVTVTLQKSKVYGFVVKQTSAVGTIGNNGTFNATFSVLNTGNSKVNVTLSSGSPYFWSMQFNRTYLNIQPGQEYNVSASVTAQHNPPAGTDQVPVSMSYSGQSSSGYLSVNVTSASGFTASRATGLGTVNGSKVWIPINVQNTGNSPVTVNFSIGSASLGTLKAYNWNATLYYGGVQAQKVIVPYNSTVTVYAVLSPLSGGQTSSVTFTVNFNSTSHGQALAASTSVPSISSISPYPGGSGIIGNYTGNPYSSIEIGLIMIAVLVVGGIIASGIRSRNRRGKR